MIRTLGELSQLVGGVLNGDPNLTVHGAAPLTTALAGEITLLDSPDRVKKMVGSGAAAVVVPSGTVVEMPSIEVADVHAAFTKIVTTFRPPRVAKKVGVSSRAVISSTARLAPNVEVHPLAVIGDDVVIGANSIIYGGVQIMAGSQIGENCTIYPNAVLYENTIVGARGIIHAGAVLGGHGFGYRTVAGRHELTSQLGNVELGDDVEIGAGSTIDRGTYGPTRIGDGTKLDDQVMIGHNCSIGKHNLICAQVGIAGSTSTGEYVVIAGHSAIRDHVHIGSRAVLMAMCGIKNNVADGAVMLGIPATPEREQKQQMVALMRLPEMRKQFMTLQATVAALQASLAVASGEASSSADTLNVTSKTQVDDRSAAA